MNGKIKTKFAALFAVALMITVCVVPVVGNEDVQAITVPVENKTLTIAGTVYDADGEELVGAEVIITVTIGNDESTYTVKTLKDSDAGEYTCQVIVPKKTIIDEIEVKINTSDKLTVNGEEKDNPAAGLWSSAPTLTVSGIDVEKQSNISGLDFKAGYYRISGDLKYASGQPYTEEVDVYLYEVNEVTPATNPMTYTYTMLDKYKATSIDGKYAIYVPTDIEPSKEGGMFAVGAQIPNISYSSTSGVAISGSTDMNITSKDTYLFEIKSNALKDEKIELSVPSTSPVKLDDDEFKIIAGTEDKPYEPISVEYTLDAEKNGKKEVIVTGDYGALNDPLEIKDNEIEYVQVAFVKGTVAMGDVPALEGKVTLTLLQGTTEKTYDADVINGKFIVWYKNNLKAGDVEDIAKVTYKSGNFEYVDDEVEFTYLESIESLEIDVDDNGYVEIAGTVIGLAADSKISIEVDGTDIFGLDKKGLIETAFVENEGDMFTFMAPVGSVVTITPDENYTYDVASIELQVLNEIGVSFTMDTKDVEIEFVDYDDEPLNGVTVYPATYNKGQEKWILGTVIGGTTNPIVSVNGKWVWKVAGNLDLSETYVVFEDATTKRTFENDKNSTPLSPVSLESIDETVKVLDVRKDVQILDADGMMIEELDIDVQTYSVYVKNGVEVFGDVTTPVYGLEWDTINETYYFVGLVGDQEISSTANDILAIVIPDTVTGIFDPIYPVNEDGVTVIQSYRNTVTGTIYEADEKTVITSIPGTNVVLAKGGTIGTGQIKKDGTFVINTYTENISGAQVQIVDAGGYTFATQPAFKDDVAVTSYYANEMSFAVTFTDADGKKIEYNSATVAGKLVNDGKVIIIAGVDSNVTSSVTAKDGTPRTMNGVKVTEDMISSKKIDFVSDKATYTVKLTDSKGKVWENAASMTLVTVKDTINAYAANTFNIVAGKGEATAVLTVPVEGESYAVKADDDTYFGTTEYAFTDYAVTVPAIGSFVEVTAAEANGTLFTSDVIDSAKVYVKGKSTYENYSADNNVVEYFAVDGKEYEFVVGESSTGYSFGNTNVNGGKISAVEGLLLANEETVSGKITFANGYNDFTGCVIAVTATYKDNGGSVAGVPDADLDGQYKIIVDVDKVEKYDATISTSLAKGSSATPEIVLDESYITGAVPSGATVADNATIYKDGAFVKNVKVYPGVGKYDLIINASDGDEIVMTITANGKTFQQAIDLKAVQNDIIVPGSLVSDKTNALFADFYVIYGADTAVIGSKIVLSAQKTISAPMDVANVAYTTLVFDGWYVNGEKVSDDVNATYTVNGPCEVYAYYTEKVTETGAVADSSNDLSMDVLILGIVIVVLALLAFVYAVKFKKE